MPRSGLSRAQAIKVRSVVSVKALPGATQTALSTVRMESWTRNLKPEELTYAAQLAVALRLNLPTRTL